MHRPVTLELWQVILLASFAAWALLALLLVPSVRWYLRRRVNRAIEELNQRLDIRLQPFKLTKRAVLIDRLTYDARVLEAVEEYAEEHGTSREIAVAKVQTFAHEIVPAFNAYAYFRVGYWISKRIAQTLYRVRLGSEHPAALSQLSERATVVFVMNHRSNMDYVIVPYLVASRTALSYAVGEWARVWPLQSLVRVMGAYFVRRRSGEVLYRRVLERYIQMATESGVTQAVFPEGRLSRDGRIGEPKLGIIEYMLRTFDPEGERDIVFVPVGINYDRTLEDRKLIADDDAEAQERGGRLRTAVSSARFVAKNLWLMLRQRWFRFGYACVNFGEPISLAERCRVSSVDPRAALAPERPAFVNGLAGELMSRVEGQVPVLPVALVAHVFLAARSEALTELELLARVHDRIEALESRGVRVYVPRADRGYAARAGLRMLVLRHLVDEEEGLFRARSSEAKLLAYYANSLPPELESNPGAKPEGPAGVAVTT